MKEIIISEIEILPVKPRNGLIAFASCVVNNQFYIGNIAVYTSLSSLGEYRLVYPTKVLTNGKQISCICPIQKTVGDQITKAISEKINEMLQFD